MRFDPALAAREAFEEAASELGPDWDQAVELEETFSSQAGPVARGAYDALLALAARHPDAHSFHAFCVYITWQQVTEEPSSQHFETGRRLAERYLTTVDRKKEEHLARVAELLSSFRAGLGLDEEDEIQIEYWKDTPKGGD